MKQQDALCRALERRGYKLDPNARSRKYKIYYSPQGQRYYVGRAGALRCGKSISDSLALPETTRKRLIKEGEDSILADFAS